MKHPISVTEEFRRLVRAELERARERKRVSVSRPMESSVVPPREQVAEIVRAGQAIQIPEGMTYKNAMKSLQRRMEYEEEITEITEPIDAFPWDGAYALQAAINKQFGWSQAEWIPGGWFEPDQPPSLMSIEIGVGQTVNVPWGRFSLPNIKGYIETGFTLKHGLVIFQLTARVQRKNEAAIKELAEETRRIVRAQSIYRGKAIKVRFTDEKGKPIELPIPKFLDVTEAKPDRLVFSAHVSAQVATNLYTPLQKYARLKRHGVPFKRGVLLCGDYGTGKTELAFTAGHLAAQNGITFLYCETAAEFTKAIQFAQQYSPAVVFCEDIDRVSKGERTDELNIILNTIDGIEAKSTEVMVVLTTNDVEGGIHESLLRPGRMDAVIEIERPDPGAVEGLVRLYARELLSTDEDLGEVGTLLQGNIPAVVREVVERSKLAAIRLSGEDEDDTLRLSGPALAESALTMKRQVDLLERKPKGKPSDLENAGHIIGQYVRQGMKGLDGDTGGRSLVEAGAAYAQTAHDNGNKGS